MFGKYLNIIFKKIKKYDKYASNPFLNKDFEYNPFKSIYEQTYIWVEKPDFAHNSNSAPN